MEHLSTSANGNISPAAKEAGADKKLRAASSRYWLLTASGLVVFLAGILVALRMPIRPSALEIAIETPNDRSQTSNIHFKTPQTKLRGTVDNAYGLFGRNMVSESEVYPCINGWCEPGLIGKVDTNGVWVIPNVPLRHPAENTGEGKLQVILVKNRHSHAPAEYLYSNTLNAAFPKPEIKLESICDYPVTASIPRRIGCKSLKLEGKARSLLWMRERICVQIITRNGKTFCLPAALHSSDMDENSWTLRLEKTVTGELKISIGLDSTTTGEVCSLQSVLFSGHFQVSSRVRPLKEDVHGNL